MTRDEAEKILQISAGASEADREAKYEELRRQLEDKLAKAPTPGLRDKYRNSLKELEDAHAILAKADDTTSLPVLDKSAGDPSLSPGAAPGASRPDSRLPGAPQSGTRAAQPARRSSSKEFVMVAVVGVLVLAAGGWFVMKMRADAAEKARVEAELAQAAEEEQRRIEQASVGVRTALAEARLVWEAAEREERDAERRLTDLRNEQRSLRDPDQRQLDTLNLRIGSAQKYSYWLRDLLAAHPARLSRVKAEELLQAKAVEAAAAEVEHLKIATASLQEELAATRNGEGAIEIASNLPTVTWQVRGPLGVVQSGRGPSRVSGLPFASYDVIARAPLFPTRRFGVDLEPGKPAATDFQYEFGTLSLGDTPADAIVRINELVVPVDASGKVYAPAGEVAVSVTREGYLPRGGSAVIGLENESSLAMDWVPIDDPKALLAEYVGQIERYGSGTTYMARLDDGIEAGMRAGVVSSWQATSYWKKAYERAAGIRSNSSRIRAEFFALERLFYLDRRFAAEQLRKKVDEVVALPESTRRYLTGTLIYAFWSEQPALGEKLRESISEALAANKSTSYAGAVYRHLLIVGRDADAEAWKEKHLARLDAKTRENANRTFASYRRLAEGALAVHPFRNATYRADVSGLRRLAESTSALNHYSFCNFLDTAYPILGADESAIEWAQSRNTSATNMRYVFRAMGRLDLYEKLTRGLRTNREDELAEAAVYYAFVGNKTRARQLVGLVKDTKFYSVRSWRAVAEALLGDRKAAIESLDYLESRNVLANKGWNRTYFANMMAASYILRDSARATRLREKLNDPKIAVPADRLVLARRFDDAFAAIAAKESSDLFFNSRSFFEVLLLDSDADKRLRWLPNRGAMERMTLTLLWQSAAFPKRNVGTIPVPEFEEIPAAVVYESRRYFPSSVSAKGIKTGNAKVAVEISAYGAVGEISTISASDPAFAAQLSSALKQSKFIPALRKGRPVASTLEISRTFRLP